MAAKSILVVGEVADHTMLIAHALMKGYRVLYTRNLRNELAFLNQECVILIIIGNMDGYIEAQSLIELIRSGVPAILARGDEFEDIIIGAYRGQMPVSLRRSGDRERINNAVKCFFNRGQEEATGDDCLTSRQENGLTSLELNGDGNAQKTQDRIERAISFMEQHYNDEISLAQIAHSAFLSIYHFCRLFKRRTGITCSRYLSILRVEKAKELLRETELSVTEISYEAGFNSLTYFERVFKSSEGTTPSAYRRCC